MTRPEFEKTITEKLKEIQVISNAFFEEHPKYKGSDAEENNRNYLSMVVYKNNIAFNTSPFIELEKDYVNVVVDTTK